MFELTLFDFRNYNVYASYVTNESWTFAKPEFDSFIIHHEKHVRDLYEAREQRAGSPGLYFRQVYEFFKTKAGVAGDNVHGNDDTPANRNAFLRLQSAFDIGPDKVEANKTRAPHAFLEIEPWVSQFLATGDAEVSNRFLSKAMPQIVIWFNAATNPLKETGAGDLQNPKKHVVEQYKKFIKGFPELKHIKEYEKEYWLTEPKF